MNILFVHNRYLIRGGEDESTEMEIDLMIKHGHNVTSYIVENEQISNRSIFSVAFSVVWSRRTYREVRKLIKENRIEILHVQNFFPLISPSVYYAAKSLKIPVVQAIRNYRLICPNALFFRDNKICTECSSKLFPYPSIFYKCYRKNRLATFTTALMLFIHRILGTWHKKVDKFVAVSEFVKHTLVNEGYDADKIVVKPNFLLQEFAYNSDHDNYFIYIGRLSNEKGIKTLCSAWEILGKRVPLKIIGEGDDVDKIKRLQMEGYNIDYLGKLPMNETLKYLSNTKALVIPSEWFEPFGRVIIEAYALSIPVIASNIGGIKELVDDNKTGYLFEPSNYVDLAEKVTKLNDNINLSTLKKNAYSKSQNLFSSESNYKFLIRIYEDILNIN